MNEDGTEVKFTRIQYLHGEVTHRQYYGQFVTADMKRRILTQFTADELRAAYKADAYFNSVPLPQWDAIYHVRSVEQHGRYTTSMPYSVGLMFQRAGDYLTPAGIVCLLKEAALQIVEATKGEQ